MVAIARNTPRRRRTGRPSGTAMIAGRSAAAANTAANGACAFNVRSAAAYAPTAMKPALASESWPQESVAYTDSARSPLMPTKATSDWYARSRSRTSRLAHGGLPEEAARPREQHHEEHRERDRVAQGRSEARDGEHLDEAE